MFNLEQSIADWRRQMLAAGIETPVPLEELEIHLREEIERQMKSGADEQKVFEIAARNVGRAPELKMEFIKVSAPVETQFVKLAGIACVIVAFSFSLWTLPFLFHHEMGLLAKASGLAAIAATAFGWRYNHKLLPVIHNQPVRMVIGLACWLGCVVWMLLFIMNFLPHLMLHPAGMEMPAGRLMAAFLWGWTVMAILGSVGHGLEKAARQTSAQYV
jgi:hypothetical protein